MAEKKKAITELKTLSMKDRKIIGTAIIDGLINPAAITFERLASEGGDYDQDGGGYTQSGGGGHDQGGDGDYNQSAMISRDSLDIINVVDLVKRAK